MRNSQIRFIQLQGFPGTEFPDSLYGALMFQPKMVGAWIALGVALQSPSVFVALSAVLWWSTCVPSLNPFDALYNRVIADPRGVSRLGVAPAPRRFSQSMAGSLALVIAIAIFEDATITSWALEGVFAAASMSVVLRDFCMPAYVYHLLRSVPSQKSAFSDGPG